MSCKDFVDGLLCLRVLEGEIARQSSRISISADKLALLKFLANSIGKLAVNFYVAVNFAGVVTDCLASEIANVYHR